MKLIIDIPEDRYKDVLEDTYSGTPFENKVFTAIANGIPLDNATRKEVHKLIFGIEPPELGSPYCACANEGCEMCIHKDDLNCDVNWWNSQYQKGVMNEQTN